MTRREMVMIAAIVAGSGIGLAALPDRSNPDDEISLQSYYGLGETTEFHPERKAFLKKLMADGKITLAEMRDYSDFLGRMNDQRAERDKARIKRWLAQ